MLKHSELGERGAEDSQEFVNLWSTWNGVLSTYWKSCHQRRNRGITRGGVAILSFWKGNRVPYFMLHHKIGRFMIDFWANISSKYPTVPTVASRHLRFDRPFFQFVFRFRTTSRSAQHFFTPTEQSRFSSNLEKKTLGPRCRSECSN